MSSYSPGVAKSHDVPAPSTPSQEPLLKDDDARFFDRHMDQGGGAARDSSAVKIADDGEVTKASKEETIGPADQVIVPEMQPEPSNGVRLNTDSSAREVATSSRKTKGIELPSQEEAEAATRGFDSASAQDANLSPGGADEKRTWISYLASMRPRSRKSTEGNDQQPSSDEQDGSPSRTWSQYASSYVPSYASLPSIPSIPAAWKPQNRSPAASEPVYDADGNVDEGATRAAQEKEVTALLDRLNLSSINNRVFAFSDETQHIYERFSQVLKDTIAGVPTAYDDMDALMRDAGPKLEKQFRALPPFVQTLVKSLPLKLAPELMAVAGEKPGADMRAKLDSASTTGGDAEPGGLDQKQKKKEKEKRRIPNLKRLISREGAVAGMLRNVVTFLQTRFPFLASTTSVVMSLAVFILMFVFWYCHKRGREVRLANAASGGQADGNGDDEDDENDVDVEASDEDADDHEEKTTMEEKEGAVKNDGKPQL